MLAFEEIVERLTSVGYCRIPGVYTEFEVAQALERVRECNERGKNRLSERVPFLNVGQPTVYNLQNKGRFFLDFLFKSQLLQQVLMHFLNDVWFKQIPENEPNYVLRSYLARSSNHQMPMHIDSFVPYLGNYVFIMQYSIILERQSSENGCTVVVPGSHVAGEYTTQEAFEDAVPIESEVGDVVIWDSRLWHGTTENRSGSTRWAMVATWCRWWLKQHWNVTQNLPEEIYEELTDSQKAVLGFCSMPWNDEVEGIDIKRGYDLLPREVSECRRRHIIDPVDSSA